MNALIWLLSPLGRYLALALAIAAAFGGYVLKQRNDAVQDERAKVEVRKTNDIKKATKARVRVRGACDRAADCGMPNHFRD